MKRIAAIVFILAIGLAGCSNHFYRIEGDTLHLFLVKPEARDVLFAFSADGYAPHPASRDGSATWKISVPVDTEFTYFYIVDGAVFMPPCKFTEADDFGSENCIFVTGM